MPIGWIIAFVVLWLAVIALAVILLGALRQVTLVVEQLANSLPANLNPVKLLGPEVGKPLPSFSARGIDGQLVGDQQLRGRAALLLFVSPDCPPCRTLTAELGRRELGTLASQLIIITEPASARMSGIPEGLRVLIESDNEVSERLSVHGKPFAIAIDPDGIVRDASVPNNVGHLNKLAADLPIG